MTRRKAIRITPEDYKNYDYIIGMEETNIRNIERIVGPDIDNKLSKLLDFSDNPRDIADPWYTRKFDDCYDDVLRGCEGLLKHLGY